jgi:hypothetical protein
MKKIIAAAVATAFVAPAFAAEVTLTGDVEYTFSESNSVVTGSTGDADFKITATEELPNGMSVMAYVDVDDYDVGDQSSRASKMELSGSFGKIEIGKDAGDAAGEYDEVADVAESGAGTTFNDGASQQNHIVFHPNTGVEGLSVAFSYGAPASGTADTTSFAIKYDTGFVTIAYGAIEETGSSAEPTVLSVSGSFGPVYAGYEKINDQAGVANDGVTNIGITYDYGMGKLAYETNEVEDGSTTTDKTAVSLSYKLGSTVNTYVAFKNDDDGSTSTDTTTVGIEYAF